MIIPSACASRLMFKSGLIFLRTARGILSLYRQKWQESIIQYMISTSCEMRNSCYIFHPAPCNPSTTWVDCRAVGRLSAVMELIVPFHDRLFARSSALEAGKTVFVNWYSRKSGFERWKSSSTAIETVLLRGTRTSLLYYAVVS